MPSPRPPMPEPPPRPAAAGPAGMRSAPLFVLASGFSALVYQVLWLRDLSILFGNTAQASAVGFAVFFGGLAAGAQFWGRRTARTPRPLATYGWLELGIVATAALGFWLLDVYRLLYAPLFQLTGETPVLFLATRAAFAAAVLFPPAFFMGGTIPVLGQAVIPHRRRLGRTGALLYGLNTFGAAAGALAAGFFLPVALGFGGAYAVALAVNAAIGAAALLLARGAGAATIRSGIARRTVVLGERHTGSAARPLTQSGALPRRLLALAAASGFLMLALEVAAVRLFAQVLQNSVYTFSTVLTVFLLALGSGALLASRLARTRVSPVVTLAALLTMSGMAIATVPFTFHMATDGLAYVAVTEGWYRYLARVAATVTLVLGLPSAVAGTVFPFLLRLAQDGHVGAGRAIGTLTAWNLAGAIAGSVLTGFVLLPALGLWGVFTLLPAVYLASGLILLWTRPVGAPLRFAPLAGLVLLGTLLNPFQLPMLRLGVAGEQVLQLRESAYGVTAVVERDGDRLIRVNNHYSLGGSGAADYERNQTLIPLMSHPHPRSVFFLGMGTGITAGAAVQPPVERIVVAELIPDVVELARRYFRDVTNQLFDDPRVTVVVADGRTHLAGVADRHDLIVADLFVPWEAGTGNLYSREHFRTVRDRLTPGGLFVQWLPLYQMSRHEFMIVARTLLDVFPHVTVWRGDFLAERPIVALVAGVDPAPLDPRVLSARAREIAGAEDEQAYGELTLAYYAGNLAQARHLVPPGPLNTDRRPILEYDAPVTHRQQRIGAASWFNAFELLAFFEALLEAVPPHNDPHLSKLTADDLAWVHAGLHRHARAIAGVEDAAVAD